MAKKQGLIPLRDRVRKLERIYGMVEREIAKELALMDVGNYQELRTVKTQERIDKLIRMLNRAAIKWSKEAIPMAYKESYLISKTRLEILGVERDKEFNVKKHRFSVEDYIDATMDDLIKANQSIKVNVAMYIYLMRQASLGIMQIQEFGVEDEVAIEKIVSQAIERGEKPGYATRLIRGYFKAKTGDGQFILINGRNYNLKNYSKLVARTRMRQVQTEAVLNTCEQYENDLVKVSDHNSEWDDICLEYEGKVFSISGKHPLYPLLDRRTPFHRNCKHNILPTSEEALDVSERLRPKPYEIEATGPRQTKVASVEDALNELPRRHVQRVEKYYIDTTSQLNASWPDFQGRDIAGYWDYQKKAVHLNSKWTTRQVIFHETGHAAFETGIVPYAQKSLWQEWYKKATFGQIKYPSQYALTNVGEFFAECYSHYYLKNYHLIDDGIKKWFDKTFVGGL